MYIALIINSIKLVNMNTYQILLHHAKKGQSLRVWGLIQEACGLSRITWYQFNILTTIMRKNGQFRIK